MVVRCKGKLYIGHSRAAVGDIRTLCRCVGALPLAGRRENGTVHLTRATLAGTRGGKCLINFSTTNFDSLAGTITRFLAGGLHRTKVSPRGRWILFVKLYGGTIYVLLGVRRAFTVLCIEWEQAILVSVSVLEWCREDVRRRERRPGVVSGVSHFATVLGSYAGPLHVCGTLQVVTRAPFRRSSSIHGGHRVVIKGITKLIRRSRDLWRLGERLSYSFPHFNFNQNKNFFFFCTNVWRNVNESIGGLYGLFSSLQIEISLYDFMSAVNALYGTCFINCLLLNWANLGTDDFRFFMRFRILASCRCDVALD